MLAHPAMICDWPQVVGRTEDRKLNYGRVRRHFDRCLRRLRRWWKNLHTRTRAAPPARYAEAAEAIFATDLQRSNKDRILYFVCNLLPLSCIEGRPWLHGNDTFFPERQYDAARRSRLRKIERVRVSVAAVKLTKFLMRLTINPQLIGVEVAQVSRRRFSGMLVSICPANGIWR